MRQNIDFMDLEDRGLMTPAGRHAFKTRPHWSHLRRFLDILRIPVSRAFKAAPRKCKQVSIPLDLHLNSDLSTNLDTIHITPPEGTQTCKIK